MPRPIDSGSLDTDSLLAGIADAMRQHQWLAAASRTHDLLGLCLHRFAQHLKGA